VCRLRETRAADAERQGGNDEGSYRNRHPRAGGPLGSADPKAGVARPIQVPEGPPQRVVRGGLARGDGRAGDDALLEGDRAYDGDDLPAAKRQYQRARQLAPKDPAPRVGIARVALAESGVPTDYAAAPKNAKMQALLRDLDAALKLDKNYGPAHVERGRVLLILGRADDALRSLQRARGRAARDGARGRGAGALQTRRRPRPR
jgi:hypothetical protein